MRDTQAIFWIGALIEAIALARPPLAHNGFNCALALGVVAKVW